MKLIFESGVCVAYRVIVDGNVVLETLSWQEAKERKNMEPVGSAKIQFKRYKQRIGSPKIQYV